MHQLQFSVILTLVSAFQVPANIRYQRLPKYVLGQSLDFSKQQANLTGGFTTCFGVTLTAQGHNFSTMVDTGSSDTTLPLLGINDYVGPVLDIIISNDSQLESGSYGDKSFWNGYVVNITIGVANTNISGLAPVIAIAEQSTEPLFINNDPMNGLLGVAFSSLATPVMAANNLMDAWVEGGKVKRNQIAFHGCPYSRENQSWIDFGNETPFDKCGNVSATIKMPRKTYYTVDLYSVLINGEQTTLPATFQQKKDSILDSCTSLIYLPLAIVEAFRDTLVSSDAFSYALTSSSYFPNWIVGKSSLKLGVADIDFSLLPNVTFVLASENKTTVSLVLGPRHYIQADAQGYCNSD